jgi:hypothetical protein
MPFPLLGEARFCQAGSAYIPYLTPYVEIILGGLLSTYCASPSGCPTTVTQTNFGSYSGVSGMPSLITNADQGVLLSFQAIEGSQSQNTDVYCEAPVAPTNTLRG